VVTEPSSDPDDLPQQPDCIAFVGDVHSAWTPADTQFFNASAYPVVLVAGDLGGSEARDGLSVARSMAGLTRRTLVMPGNNDVREYAKISAELTYRHGRQELLGGAPGNGPRTCGYSLHELQLGERELTIIAGRPFAMGGCELSFADELERSFGVRSIEASTERLCALVDAAASDQLVFFAHNGPYGLGDAPDAPWGRDFDPAAGDWGDRDLRAAIDHAIARKRRPLAVLAGHMHWRLRTGGLRRWQLRQDGILYLNAARVPRVFAQDGGKAHQHVAVFFDTKGAHAQEVIVTSDRISPYSLAE
jgi:uncharacterized protein (TIGR04168 family)